MLSKGSDVKSALKAGAYQSALALALTLPDICGQVEYPNENSVGTRYSQWCEEYMNFADAHVGFGTEPAKLNGTLCYALRCAFLHSGNDDILSQRAARNSAITSFELLKPEGLNGNGFAYRVGNQQVATQIDMSYLCDLICEAVEKYYNSHADKSIFEDHTCMVK